MYVIAGLGNPGPKYRNTRHNMGFMALECLAGLYGIKIEKSRFRALVGEGRISGERVLLVEPQTFMNLSGEAVRSAVDYYGIDLSELLVIYDDFDIPAGSVRIRPFGSAGTHNGMRSVIASLGSGNFPRIRIGTGEEDKGDLLDFVTGTIPKSRREALDLAVYTAARAAGCWVAEGIERAMSRYNTRRTGPGVGKAGDDNLSE